MRPAGYCAESERTAEISTKKQLRKSPLGAQARMPVFRHPPCTITGSMLLFYALTVSKRVEFSASRRLFSRNFRGENRRPVKAPRFTAPAATMWPTLYSAWSARCYYWNVINISEIKERAGQIIHDRYDHAFERR
jgi:hypothetical protein